MIDFVNRATERGLFSQMISGQKPYRLMPLLIESGHGKSFLLAQFMEICKVSPVRYAWLDFDTKQQAGMSYADCLMRLTKELGVDHFAATLKELTSTPAIQVQTGAGAGEVSLGEANRLPQAQVSQLQGRDKIEIRDNHITIHDSSGALHQQRQTLSGLAWKADLARLCQNQAVVLLFDTYESVTDETRAWLHEWLFQPLAEYSHLYLVVAGQPTDKLRDYFITQRHVWRPLMRPVQLAFEPFDESHVHEYLEKRGLPKEPNFIVALSMNCQVLPMRSIAEFCDGWLQRLEGQA